MLREIERKFFFDPALWKQEPLGQTRLEQGYLTDTGGWEVRLRRSDAERRYTMKRGTGLNRAEWEIKLTAADFDALWSQTEGNRLSKFRQRFRYRNRTVALEGLVVAEVEFDSDQAAQHFALPRAFGPELTYDPRFKNRSLASSAAEVPRLPSKNATGGWSFGAVPVVKRGSNWHLIVVSTRRRDRWIFPKGQPEAGLSPEKVALMEAKEEAGITGKVEGHPIVLPYRREANTTNLLLYPVAVTGLADQWLESPQRERKVVPLAECLQGTYGELVQRGAEWVRDRQS